MATLNLRNIPDKVHHQLKVRAAQHGRSMEREARSILEEACMGEPERHGADSLQQWVCLLYGDQLPVNVVDELIAERRREVARE